MPELMVVSEDGGAAILLQLSNRTPAEALPELRDLWGMEPVIVGNRQEWRRQSRGVAPVDGVRASEYLDGG